MAAPVETIQWTLICRVCGEDLKLGRKGQVFNLFLNLGLKALLEAITEVPVVMGDGVSVYAHSICLDCKQLLEKYDRARVNLEKIVHMIRKLCNKNTAGRQRCKMVYDERGRQSTAKTTRPTIKEASTSTDLQSIPQHCGTVHIKTETRSPSASPDRKRSIKEASSSADLQSIPQHCGTVHIKTETQSPSASPDRKRSTIHHSYPPWWSGKTDSVSTGQSEAEGGRKVCHFQYRSILPAPPAVLPPTPQPVLQLVSQPASQKQTGKLKAAVPLGSLGSVKITEPTPSAVLPPTPKPVLPLVSQPASQKQTGMLKAAVPFSLGSVKSAVQRLTMDRQELRKSIQPISTALTIHNIAKAMTPTPAAVPQPIQVTSTQNTSLRIRPPVVKPSRRKIEPLRKQRRRPTVDRKILKVQRITQKGQLSRILHGPWEKIGEVIFSGKTHRLPHAMVTVPGMLDLTVDVVLKLLKKECKALCGPLFNSVLRQTNPQALTNFKWDDLIAEWRANAPIFLKFLESASSTVYDQTLKLQGLNPLQKQRKKTQAYTMAMAGATLLRSRDCSMSAPMYRNTFLLRHGGVKKRSIQQLTRIGVCVSYLACQTMSKLDESWDTKLLRWIDDDSGCQPTDEECPIEEDFTDGSDGQKEDGDASSSGPSEMEMTDSGEETESEEETPCQSDQQEVSRPNCEESPMSDFQPLSESELTTLSDFQPLSESELTALYVEQERSSGFLTTTDYNRLQGKQVQES